MKDSKFSKPPMSEEKRKKMEEWANLSDGETPPKKQPILKKEKTKPLYFQVPQSLWDDIHEIMARSGISMTAICLDLLRSEVKRKLKELREH